MCVEREREREGGGGGGGGGGGVGGEFVRKRVELPGFNH